MEYEFPCSEKEEISEEEFDRFSVMGSLEACLHSCPKERAVHDLGLIINSGYLIHKYRKKVGKIVYLRR
ncbi:hypothetical protein AKJ65_03870 [candidate division MSBL1 archaeon SCGC-AAA259E19]|uniref:Uncharacterized protein n=1 Tax=candidate division MSBL1 archaeon SCGC-AAA259E19 TaxID=1698264 RepID=A0A133UK99_9EURY|nr:hypothetical protein AKJ65_03870 [candidate division MSBL1 archaeon SCGC-AAA259E19]